MQLLTPKQVSEMLGISLASLYGWVRAGDIPALRIGKQWRFDPAAVEAWLKDKSKGAAQ